LGAVRKAHHGLARVYRDATGTGNAVRYPADDTTGNSARHARS